MNWPIWLFVIVGGLLLVGTILTRRAIFIVLLAVTLWLAIDFDVWSWVPWVFWILVIFTGVLIVLDILSEGETNAARITAIPALLLAVTVVAVDLLTANADVDAWFDGDDSEEVQTEEACVGTFSEVIDCWNRKIVALLAAAEEQADDEKDQAESAEDTDDGEDEEDSEEATASTEPQGFADDLSDEEMQALIELLTVDTITASDCVSLEEVYGANSAMPVGNGQAVYKWNIGALKPVSEGNRLWSDAISVPFVETEPLPMLAELELAHCVDPLQGVMFANYLAGLTVGGVELVELNPWLEPFAGEPEETINDAAAEFVPLLDNDDPSQDEVEEAHEAQLEWQVVAAKLNTMLERFQLGGIEARASVLNYHLVAGGLVVGGLPPVGLNDAQEDLPALVFTVTRKDNCPLLVIGFNTGDKRLEEFAPSECLPPPTVPPGTTPPGTTPPGTTVPGTTVPGTTVPGTTVPVTTVPTTPPTTTVPCGNKNVIDPVSGKCVPNIKSGSTLPPSPTTTPTQTTVAPPPTPPSTAPPDTLPPGVTPTTHGPDYTVVTYVPTGGTQTTTPIPTVATVAPPPPNTLVTDPAPTPTPP